MMVEMQCALLKNMMTAMLHILLYKQDPLFPEASFTWVKSLSLP